MIHDLKVKGQINTFQAVKPEDGWSCEYSLDNADTEIRFRAKRGKVEMEIQGYSTTPAYHAATREARAEGYTVR